MVARSAAEKAKTESFDLEYRRGQLPVMRALERAVCGCDYGGTSWTTRAEADRIIARLELGPDRRHLDIGAGSGWPGLYFARLSGCDMTLIDLPFSGLKIARERAQEEAMDGRCRVAVADGTALPFAADAFDSLSHSDVLCCLLPKAALLAACHRVLRGGGRMVFTVISVAPGLSAAAYRRALANGPEFIESQKDYPNLLQEGGWRILGQEDITPDYRGSCQRQLAADAANAEALGALLGAAEFDERREGWQRKLDALDDGLLRRELFVAAPSA